MADELSLGAQRAVVLARRQFSQALRESAPSGSNIGALAAVAITGLFVDVLSGLTTAPAIINVMNQQLVGAGLEIVQTKRN